MHTENIQYSDGDVALEGYLAYDPKQQGARPTVIVGHDWSGRNEFACQKAEELAKLGYVGFALDMYGKGVQGTDTNEKTKMITPFIQDRSLLRRRVTAAFDTVLQLDVVDNEKIGFIGFCFGGMCGLDLVRSGADVKGIVCFHGLLAAPNDISNETIKAKILACHGHDDPMVPPQQVAEFEKEMTEAQVDWQVHVYGKTSHAFTNPAANDPKLGTIYNDKAASRSWASMQAFLNEVLARNPKQALNS